MTGEAYFRLNGIDFNCYNNFYKFLLIHNLKILLKYNTLCLSKIDFNCYLKFY